MPLEEFYGRDGLPRLIAAAPVEPTEFATIHTDEFCFRVSHQGKKSNGYPALSPIWHTLPLSISQQIETERRTLLDKVAEQAKAYRPRLSNIASLFDEDVCKLQHVVPVLSSIKEGYQLQLILPKYLFPTSRYYLGTVRRYEIVTPWPRPR